MRRLSDRIEAIGALKTKDPAEALGSDAKHFPFERIYCLRYCKEFGSLDVIGPDDLFDTVADRVTRVTKEIFAVLHEQLAPQAAIETESVRGWRNHREPLGCLAAVVVFTIFTTRFWVPGPKQSPAAGQWYATALQWLYDLIGETTVNVFAIVMLALAGIIVFGRWADPLKFQTITVRFHDPTPDLPQESHDGT